MSEDEWKPNGGMEVVGGLHVAPAYLPVDSVCELAACLSVSGQSVGRNGLPVPASQVMS